MDNKLIAETILQQIGGSARLQSFIGAKNFLIIDQGLQFKWAAKSKNGANTIQITLNSLDLYDIKFLYCRGMSVTTKKELSDVYCDQLVELFEEETGLFLHF